ncbi:DNA repair protein RadC [bacterium]|nr:DNA repair protein RadC [bacterium]
MEPSSPAARRHARQLRRELHERADTGSVREEDLTALPEPGSTQARGLEHDVSVVEQDDFLAQLSGEPGPIQRLQWLERRCRLLKGRRAASFLHELGVPTVIPSKGRRRLLHRVGWLEEEKDSSNCRVQTIRILDRLASVCGTSLGELETVLAAFCGEGAADTKSAATCLASPQCGRCPLVKLCDYGRFQETHRIAKEDGSANRALKQAVSKEDLPREKLGRLGPEALSSAELLAILIRTGTARKNALDLAHDLLRNAGSLERLARQTIREMQRTSGLGEVRAITIKAALELARRLSTTPASDAPTLNNARKVFELLRGYYLDKQKENFVALTLNTKNKLIRQISISEGSLNQSLVHPREAFQEALRDSAYAIIFAHNHPSGDVTPSRADRLVTRQLGDAGKILGIRVLDHVIVGRDAFFSFADDPASDELE